MFNSKFNKVGVISFPEEKGITYIQMMPIIINDLDSIPNFHYDVRRNIYNNLEKWKNTIQQLFDNMESYYDGMIAYLTIDEKIVFKGNTHRTKGIHVDGMFRIENQDIKAGSFGGSFGGGDSGECKGGFYLASNVIGCRAWNQDNIDGIVGDTGQCEHLEHLLLKENESVLQPNTIYWLDRLCLHESIPMIEDTHRQLIRLSTPNTFPWISHFTENPLGIKAEGEIFSAEMYAEITRKSYEKINSVLV